MKDFTKDELLAAIDRAGFFVERSVGRPFLSFATDDDELTLWCKTCRRDSGFHYSTCVEAEKKFKRE